MSRTDEQRPDSSPNASGGSNESAGTTALGGLLHGLGNVSVPRLLRIVLPLTAVFLLAFLLEYRARVGAERAELLTQESAVIQRAIRSVERELEIAVGDIAFVADLVSQTIESETPERISMLEQSLVAFVRRRPGTFQARFIETTGRERLRVQETAGTPRVASADELQDVAGRDYVDEALQLAHGEILITAMELDVEQGIIEEPYRPLVRLATPIDDASGQRRGTVVLDVHGRHFLQTFATDVDTAGIQRMIVDSNGYWLKHRPEVEWGFVLDHGRSFERSFPEVWPRLLVLPEDGIESPEGLFFVGRAIPGSVDSETDRSTVASHSWMFISLVPRRLLDEISVQVATPLLVIAMPLYFAMVILCWLFAGALERRKLADEALQGLERARSAIMNAALDGIVVMDEHGATLEFNPAAQQIFGYTQEEARGRLVADLIIPAEHREPHRIGLERYLATGEKRIIDRHIDELTAIRKSGEQFRVELTVCPVTLSGQKIFYGFLRDLDDPGRKEADVEPEDIWG